jgi:NADPH:quinone reductase-like Zn-dependent oxidoreductase
MPDRRGTVHQPGGPDASGFLANLERLARLLDAGTLSVPIRATYPLAQADQALKALTTQHTQGKLSITLP